MTEHAAMSAQPLSCETCAIPGVLAGAGKFPADEPGEVTYGVVWRCPTCQKQSLDLCPIGPVEPSSLACLNCGEDVAENDACTGCGMSRAETADFLRLDEPSLDVAQAAAAFESGLFRHGFAVLNVLLQRETSVPEAWNEKARWYQMLKLHEAAIRCFGRAVALGPNPDAEIAMACSLAELRRYDEVIAVYDALLARTDDPESMEAGHANRGNAHAVMDRVEAAISDYEEAIRRGPNRAQHYQNYARLFTMRKQWEKAEGVLDRGLAAVTDDTKVPLLLEKARVSNEQEHADAGLTAADDVLSRVPDHPRALYQRGWALGMLGRLEEARVSMERLVELEPANEHARLALAKVIATLGEVKAAPAKAPWWKIW